MQGQRFDPTRLVIVFRLSHMRTIPAAQLLCRNHQQFNELESSTLRSFRNCRHKVKKKREGRTFAWDLMSAAFHLRNRRENGSRGSLVEQATDSDGIPFELAQDRGILNSAPPLQNPMYNCRPCIDIARLALWTSLHRSEGDWKKNRYLWHA